MSNPAEPNASAMKKLWADKRKTVRPRAISMMPGGLVKTGFLDADKQLPLVVEPLMEGTSLAVWAAENHDFIGGQLTKHGAVLFRGFQVRTQDDFEESLSAMSHDLMHYVEGATPRTELTDKVYTSTEYPPDQSIALHNELSYVMTWPSKVWFCCIVPPETRGETPIADVRRVYDRIAPEIRRRFEEKGWMLVRNFGDGLSLPWQKVFRVADEAELEAYCREARVEVEWKAEGRLRTRQVRPAVLKHPRTGEMSWFNHVAFWHVSSLDPKVRDAMQVVFKEEDLPYNTYYGDGTPIEDSVVAELRAAYDAETVAFEWKRGDVLMLENMLVAHGRSPYTGRRKILVGMGEGFSRTDM